MKKQNLNLAAIAALIIASTSVVSCQKEELTLNTPGAGFMSLGNETQYDVKGTLEITTVHFENNVAIFTEKDSQSNVTQSLVVSKEDVNSPFFSTRISLSDSKTATICPELSLFELTETADSIRFSNGIFTRRIEDVTMLTSTTKIQTGTNPLTDVRAVDLSVQYRVLNPTGSLVKLVSVDFKGLPQ